MLPEKVFTEVILIVPVINPQEDGVIKTFWTLESDFEMHVHFGFEIIYSEF